jgi:Domain of unknown function (DUF4440)
MKKIIIFTALMLLFSAIGFGQKMTTGQALEKIETDVAAGLVKGDTSVFTTYFAENAVITDPGGMMMTRAEAITVFKSGDLKFETMTVGDVKVQLYGTTAIVTYTTTDKGTFKGETFTGKHRWTDTFVKIKGKWLIVAAQGTHIMEMPK